VHALLERLDFRRPVPPDARGLQAAARRAETEPPGRQEAQELTGLVAGFAGSGLCARLGWATAVRREERFAFLVSGEVLVNGILDVVAREPGERLLIVDYKTDRLGSADPAAVVERAYRYQRLVYALAGLRSGATAVEVAHCFLEQPQRPVVATFSGEQAGELEGQLQRLAAGMMQGEFPVSPSPHRGLCAGCPAEGGLCSWPAGMTRRESPDQLF
jgi:ATP-dependent exoDNAse (exonuclease V) beta subunit